MVLFGQSAGGASVDYYSYAYTKDPIVHGFIPQSGTASLTSRLPSSTGNTTNVAATNWSSLSERLGCGTVTEQDVAKTLPCLRSKPAAAILDASAPKSSEAALNNWGPKVDGKTVFSNTNARAAKGDFIKAVLELISCVQLVTCY